jgi:phage FluMu protein Com
MQLRCTYCQTMFAISRDEMLAALQHMEQHKQKYYDAHCPKCRRANRVEGKRIEVLFPDWKKTIKAMERDAAKAEEKPLVAEAAAGSAKAANKAAGKAASAKPAPAKAKPASASPKAKPAAPAKAGAKVSGGVRKK